MHTAELWNKALEHIKERIGTTAFEAWFLPLKCREIKGQNLTLEAPDSFFKDWVINHYLNCIVEATKEVAGQAFHIEFQVNPSLLDNQERSRLEEFKTRITQPQESMALNPRYTFENFVVGPSNRFSHAASLAVTNSPAKAYNPLFIYGGVGLGKTHLMQAICNGAKERFGQELKICYMPSERFTNELISAIQHHSTAHFRQKYRNVDILVIDDIHFIAGKEATQEEFFHTFNTLYDAHKQIIISSDRPPKEISRLEERLISRFGWGLITDVQTPDLETRVAILKKKIEREPVNLPDEVVFFIAEIINTNIRELEGALIRVIAYSLLEEKDITLELTKDVLKDVIKTPQKTINTNQILLEVGREFNLSAQELKSKRRSKNIVLARQIAMYIIRDLTELSLPEIGEIFNGRDHTTVLHAYNKIKCGLVNDLGVQNKIQRITKSIQQ
jgi:chromosomal replication initiator protein